MSESRRKARFHQSSKSIASLSTFPSHDWRLASTSRPLAFLKVEGFKVFIAELGRRSLVEVRDGVDDVDSVYVVSFR